MDILYISINFPRENEGNNLYTDLAEELSKRHNITVIVTSESKNIKKDFLNKERGIEVLRVKTGNMFNVNLIKKAFSYITMQYKLKKAIKKFLNNRNYDLIVFTAPPVTLTKVVKYAMKKYTAKSYLMQKDIFPQNAVDLGILKKWNPIYWYFRHKEKCLYKTVSKIGCMSNGNIEYLLEHNKYFQKEKVELFPNAIKISKINKECTNIRKKYNIDNNSIIALYGGNFGRPQGIDFIIKVLNLYKNNRKITFLFLGKGTEREKLYNYIKNNGIKNAITLDFLPKIEYNNVLKQIDIGLVFLDYKFTIPNIPSRTLSYLEYSIPIMAATDISTDYKDIIVNQAKAGLWSESKDLVEYKKKLDYLIEHKKERIQMGQNGRKYLEDNWNVENVINIFEKEKYCN